MQCNGWKGHRRLLGRLDAVGVYAMERWKHTTGSVIPPTKRSRYSILVFAVSAARIAFAKLESRFRG
jgi:hypothetical protein